MQCFWYFVGNQQTGECTDSVATSAEAACRRLGWQRSHCVVIRVTRFPAKGALRLPQADRSAVPIPKLSL
jgi:hypothetical protein